MSKISGPLLDRIDIHLDVPALPSIELLKNVQTESSEAIKQRTTDARTIQQDRFKGTNVYANAQMTQKQIKTHCVLTEECKSFIKTAIDELGLSARAYDKVLKVARTISDLSAHETIQPDHIAEAIQYRSLDRGWWG